MRGSYCLEFQRWELGWCLPCPAPPHPQCVFACFLQRERHKLTPHRSQQIHVRRVRTRREEWERRKMGIEFMSDAKELVPAGGATEDTVPRGFVALLSRTPASACPPCFGCPDRSRSPFSDSVRPGSWPVARAIDAPLSLLIPVACVAATLMRPCTLWGGPPAGIPVPASFQAPLI